METRETVPFDEEAEASDMVLDGVLHHFQGPGYNLTPRGQGRVPAYPLVDAYFAALHQCGAMVTNPVIAAMTLAAVCHINLLFHMPLIPLMHTVH